MSFAFYYVPAFIMVPLFDIVFVCGYVAGLQPQTRGENKCKVRLKNWMI